MIKNLYFNSTESSTIIQIREKLILTNWWYSHFYTLSNFCTFVLKEMAMEDYIKSSNYV